MSACVTAAADSGELTLVLGGPRSVVSGDAVHLRWTLRNHGASPVRVASHVVAPSGPQFDELTLRLCGPEARCRDIVFQTSRTASMPVQCVLLPDQSLTQDLDLTAWLEPGTVLAPGRYRLQATYRRAPLGAGAIDAAPTPVSCMSQGVAAPGSNADVRPSLWTGTLYSATLPLTVEPKPPG